MASFIDTVKAILTRLIFAAHGIVAIYKVVSLKQNLDYCYLACTILVLAFEGIFTLTIKQTQEWKWFCPSVFLYLASVCPSIWLIELDKLSTRMEKKMRMSMANRNNLETTMATVIEPNSDLNVSALAVVRSNQSVQLDVLKNVGIPLELDNIPIAMDDDTLVVLIEQMLMLILIIGRWMLPKGDLTRDQLSQLLLVYIGTAADIIEFFDSFKDEKVNTNQVLCIMVLSIWSWSLLQFTLVLTATKGRKTRITQDDVKSKRLRRAKEICCSIDVWGILINIILQDAPFFVFRVLLIAYYRLISYMNIFFTCKNTLVITLQFYRLAVVQLEKRQALKQEAKRKLRKKIISKDSKNSSNRSNNSNNRRIKSPNNSNKSNCNRGQKGLAKSKTTPARLDESKRGTSRSPTVLHVPLAEVQLVDESERLSLHSGLDLDPEPHVVLVHAQPGRLGRRHREQQRRQEVDQVDEDEEEVAMPLLEDVEQGIEIRQEGNSDNSDNRGQRATLSSSRQSSASASSPRTSRTMNSSETSQQSGRSQSSINRNNKNKNNNNNNNGLRMVSNNDHGYSSTRSSSHTSSSFQRVLNKKRRHITLTL